MSNLAEELEPPVPDSELTAAEADTPPKEEPKVEVKQPEEKEQKVVPHQALHEERERRKQAQRELEEFRRKSESERAVLADRLNQLWAAQQQKETPQIRDPKQDPDPLDALAHNQQLTLQQMAELQRRLATEDWQRQQANQQQQVVAWAQSKAQEFRQEAPDFDDAYQHVRQMRVAELNAMGLPPQAIAQTLYQDEMWVFQHAVQSGKNPAEIVYKMAQGTGYKKKEEKPAAEEKIETLQKGTQAAKTLGNGGAQAGWPTPEQIAEMSDEEFDQLKQKLTKSGKQLSDII